jgi:serpin B
MMKRLIFTAAMAAALASPAAAQKKPDATPAEKANSVAFRFYAKEAARPGNLFFSPYGLHSAFAMAYEGAKGKTAAEMAGVFGFPKETKKLRSAVAELRDKLAVSAKGAELAQANAFWAEETYRFLPAYTGVLSMYYGAEARPANFKTAVEVSRRAINAWTGDHTGGKIKELFAEGALTPLTRLVLVNALYFKGTWASPFDKALTGPADFTRADGQKIKVNMMTFGGNRDLPYGETDAFQLVRLPYAGGGLSMLLALPRDGKKLSEAAAGLSAARLAEMRSALSEQKTKVFLPRFSFGSSFELNGTLAALGMPLAFTDAADFSGMDGSRRLYVQKAVQKTFVEVNEEGTEAAAATGVAMGVKSINLGFALFRADRPFLFFIEDAATGLILFMGRMEDPAAGA